MPVMQFHGHTVAVLDADWPAITSEAHASDLVSEAWSAEADTVAVPVARLGAGFFDLSTRFAGSLTQKLVNYRIRLAVVGDVTAFRAASDAFDAYVWESNRGTQVWFVVDEDELAARLAALG